MSDSYEETVKVNEKVVDLILEFQDEEKEEYVYQIFALLLDVTRQEISNLLRSSGLPKDLAGDMLNDIYVWMRWPIREYDYERNPVFISFWRRVVRNHLISAYKKQWRYHVIPDSQPPQCYIPSDVGLALEEFKTSFEDMIKDWPDWEKEIATAIFNSRIFVLPENATAQRALALKLKYSQSYVSHWEIWLRKEIQKRFSEK